MQTATHTCPVCEHWNRIATNRGITELKRSEARVALSNHQYFQHLKEAPYKGESINCKDIGNGIPCGNYPARTGEDCTFCSGQPKPETDKELAGNWRSLWIHQADHAEPFGGDENG